MIAAFNTPVAFLALLCHIFSAPGEGRRERADCVPRARGFEARGRRRTEIGFGEGRRERADCVPRARGYEARFKTRAPSRFS